MNRKTVYCELPIIGNQILVCFEQKLSFLHYDYVFNNYMLYACIKLLRLLVSIQSV